MKRAREYVAQGIKVGEARNRGNFSWKRSVPIEAMVLI